MKKILSLLLSLSMVFHLAGCSSNTGNADSLPQSSSVVESSIVEESSTAENSVSSETNSAPVSSENEESKPAIDKDGHFFDKKNVALYIHTYGHLPENFITKDEARDLGWEGGSVEKYAPGCAIGGDRFGNYEGQLPKAKGRTYYECDIDFDGTYRNAKRIVYSNDGLIYYTEDHYKSFELLYGEE